jgi:hypothetical protein
MDFDLDSFRSVLGLRRGLSDDHGDDLADEAHLVGRQGRANRSQPRLAVAAIHRHAAFDRVDAGTGEISAGVDGQHARHGFRRRGVDATDRAMGVTAPHHHGVGLARQIHVVGVAPLPLQKLRVLDPQHRLADAECLKRQAGFVDTVVHEAPPSTLAAELVG